MKDREPFFSLIIPTYNRDEYLIKAVDSVLAQSFDSFELIVVDDGSTDQTKTEIEKLKDERIQYYHTANKERGAARNYGASKSSGKYLSFLDSDDLLYPHHFQKAYEFIQKHNEPDVFFQQYEITSKSSSIIPYVPRYSPINLELITKGNFMSCQGVFLRKPIFEKHRFNENRALSGSEDYELWMRVAAEHPILYSHVISSALIDHQERSVKKVDEHSLIKRKELMLHYLFENKAFNSAFKAYRSVVRSNAYSYISLHLALSGGKLNSIKYLLKALKASPYLFFKRRFWVILAKLL